MTEKGNFFFSVIVTKTNISAKTHESEFPISTGMWYNINICYLILLTN